MGLGFKEPLMRRIPVEFLAHLVNIEKCNLKNQH
jgi:hypothetical protein